MKYLKITVWFVGVVALALLVSITGLVVVLAGVVDTDGESKCGDIAVDAGSDHINLIIVTAYIGGYLFLLLLLMGGICCFSNTQRLRVPVVVNDVFKFMGVFLLSLWTSQTISLAFDCQSTFGLWLFVFALLEIVLYVAGIVVVDIETPEAKDL